MLDDAIAPVASPASVEDLEDVFRAARAGDAGAFGELYRRFARVVHGIALAHAGRGDAEDLTQEAFVAVHRGLGGVRDVRALPGWICTVARNLAIDHRRSRARIPPRRVLGDVPGRADRPDQGELRERVLAHVRSLPEAYRETLVLRLVEGLDGPEIAARTGMTHGSVRVNLTRGMALLRPLLQEEGWP